LNIWVFCNYRGYQRALGKPTV